MISMHNSLIRDVAASFTLLPGVAGHGAEAEEFRRDITAAKAKGKGGVI